MESRRRNTALAISPRRLIIPPSVRWGGTTVKSFLIGCAAAIVIAVGAAMVLDRYQEPTATLYTTTGVRL